MGDGDGDDAITHGVDVILPVVGFGVNMSAVGGDENRLERIVFEMM